MSNQTNAGNSWLKVWVILTIAAISCLLGMFQQTFFIAVILIIAGIITIKLWRTKGQVRHGFEMLLYIFIFGVSGYGGQLIGVLIHFAWILIALMVFLFMIFWTWRQGKFRHQSR